MYILIVKKKYKKKNASDADYVSNQDLLDALIIHKTKTQEAETLGKKKPKLPDYIGECILKIATRLSFRPNFANYHYREEMVSDAVLNCITYVDNFDPTKSSSPFGYLTQICWFSFVRIINKEKREKYTQYKFAEQKNDKDFHNWFNETYAGIDIGRRDFFGLTDSDMDRFDIMLKPKKGKRTRKSKKPTLDL
tara:strand:- start:177 stop:755 length:579 start_codon:yes stop_codon:yes gene_type:complete